MTIVKMAIVRFTATLGSIFARFYFIFWSYITLNPFMNHTIWQSECKALSGLDILFV